MAGEIMTTTYAVHTFSHWQGATNPGRRVAVLPTRAIADALANDLSTCSFCSPGRSATYRVGNCYQVYRSKRDVTADSVSDALMQLRDRE